ncbi:MAG: transcription elongation factor GreB [Halobacteriovoraceae bacterium]|nr:transcription elongation factor GreB [Halobacteriovoraceae bacterium]
MVEKEKNYITPRGLKRLQDEYDYLKKVERPKVCDVVSWAASLGDRSENADYQYGKKRLREIDKRMRFLARRIDCAIVINPMDQKSERIQFGATVILVDEEGAKKEISIVGIDESDARSGRVSWKSPLGKSLLGKSDGDSVLVRAPSGEREFEILSFSYDDILMKEFVYESPS